MSCSVRAPPPSQPSRSVGHARPADADVVAEKHPASFAACHEDAASAAGVPPMGPLSVPDSAAFSACATQLVALLVNYLQRQAAPDAACAHKDQAVVGACDGSRVAGDDNSHDGVSLRASKRCRAVGESDAGGPMPAGDACRFVPPDALTAVLRPLLPQAEGIDCPEELLANIETLLEHSVRMSHQLCLNQLFHRADPVCVLGEWLTAALNTSIYTYELSPMVALLEPKMVELYRPLLGWDAIEGAFPPGGSTSNLYGLMLARSHAYPGVQQAGWVGVAAAAGDAFRPPVTFVSEEGHYSTKKSMGMMGLGYAACVGVSVDARGRMCPTALRVAFRRAIAEGKRPMAVVATVGTTLTGAVDALDELRAVCDEEAPAAQGTGAPTATGDGDAAAARSSVWLHVDACLGGALLHSPTQRGALRGIDRADSVAINPHKMMGATLQCSLFATRHVGAMKATFATNAAYLFNDDKPYDAATYDVGDGMFQCGRRPDVIKLWLMWRARGHARMAAYVDAAAARHARFNEILAARPDFLAVLPEPSPVPCTCFWYIPPQFRRRDDDADDGGGGGACSTDTTAGKLKRSLRIDEEPVFSVVDQLGPRAKLRLMAKHGALVTYSRRQQQPNFFRFVANGAVPWSDCDFTSFLDTIAAACLASLPPRSS